MKGVMLLIVGKLCFSKLLLIADYAILLLLIRNFCYSTEKAEWVPIIIAWIAQVAISTGAYYWKAKAENLVKLPIAMLKDIPEDMREKADPNAIIASVLNINTNNN